MKSDRLLWLKRTVVLSALALWTAGAAAETLTATAVRTNVDREAVVNEAYLVSMPWENPLDPAEIMNFNMSNERDRIGTAVRVGDCYYYYSYAEQVYGYDAIGFYRYDLEDGSLKLIADFGGTRSGISFSSLTYDYTDGTLYGLDGIMGGDNLMKIDLATGIPTKVCTLRVPADPDNWTFPDHLSTIAMNYDGVLYGLTYWGHIVKINKYTGEVKVVADMDYMPEAAFMYSGENGLFFDNSTGECYLQLYTYPKGFEVRKLDLTTGHSELFAPSFSMRGIYLPFKAAAPSSPGQVKDFVVTPAPQGELKATLTWTNPVKTYGRGGTLEELDRIEVYRNDELIHTVDSPVIGGKEIFVDEAPYPDYYTYKVVGYNDSGKGDRCCVGAYVGEGVPCTPEDLVMTPDGDNVKISWSLAEKGSFGSYIDHSKVVFDIWRCSGTVAMPVKEQIAEGVSGCEYVDSPSQIGYYSYQVSARNEIGGSDYIQSERLVCGPAITVPTTFSFPQETDAQVWTILDGNGDGGSWVRTQMGPIRAGMQSDFNALYPAPAMEYMISPYVRLEKGKRYKVTFDATPGSDKVAEVLAVSFGREPSPLAQDSVTQFNIVSKNAVRLRADLPVVEETGLYHFGFVHRTAVAYYKLLLTDISIEENHEGAAAIRLTDDGGRPVYNASISNADGSPVTFTDKGYGKYLVSYLPSGLNHLKISAPGYFDSTAEVEVAEYETSDIEVKMDHRPQHILKGLSFASSTC